MLFFFNLANLPLPHVSVYSLETLFVLQDYSFFYFCLYSILFPKEYPEILLVTQDFGVPVWVTAAELVIWLHISPLRLQTNFGSSALSQKALGSFVQIFKCLSPLLFNISFQYFIPGGKDLINALIQE